MNIGDHDCAALRAQIVSDLRADLLTEAGQLLDTARRNEAAGRRGNADYCRRLALAMCELRVWLESAA